MAPSTLAYVAQIYPAAELAPLDDAFAFAELQAFDSYICSTLHVAHAHRMGGTSWADEAEAIAAMRRKVPDAVGACYAYIEEQALAGPFVLGESYTVADPYLFTLPQWMEADGVDSARFPKAAAHRERMRARRTVQAALQAERAGAGA